MNIIDIRSQLPRNGTQDGAHAIGSITKIIIHHDASFRPDAYDDLTRYRSQANYHISKGEDGLQYHYKISNLGDVYLTRALTDTLWHCSNYAVNKSSIAICLDGNFMTQFPTRQQLESLDTLLDELCTRHPEFPANSNDVFGHKEVALPSSPTACPGINLIDYVVTYRNTGSLIPNIIIVPVAPDVIQDPPKPQYYRVYDYAGTQVGAYLSELNAQKKLDTLEAGVIKNPEGITIVDKIKQTNVVIPDKVGSDVPPEVISVPQETPEEEEPVIPQLPRKLSLHDFIMAIVAIIKSIIRR